VRRLAAAGAAIALACGAAACRDHAAERADRIARASAAEATGDLAEAGRILEQGVDRDPRDAEVRIALAEYWQRRGRPVEAREVLDELPAGVARDERYLRAQARTWLALGPLEGASRALAWLAARGEDGAADRDTFARHWRRHGVDADPRLLDPLPPADRVALAEVLIEDDQLAHATKVWRTLPAGDVSAATFDAILDAALRREKLSILAALEPELRAEPSARAARARHRLLLSRGDWAAAEALERRYLARHAGDPERYHLVLARARRESRAGSPAIGLRLAREAARLQPDRAEAFVEEALALRALHRDEKARGAIRTALLVAPDDPAALRIARELEPPQAGEPDEPRDHRYTIELR
jgi:tetratricopeptide (TPR) repeat protein